MREISEMLPDREDLTLPNSDRQELIVRAIRCAERLLSIFGNDDPCLRVALAGAIAFSHRRATVGETRKLAFDCHAVARENNGFVDYVFPPPSAGDHGGDSAEY